MGFIGAAGAATQGCSAGPSRVWTAAVALASHAEQHDHAQCEGGAETAGEED